MQSKSWRTLLAVAAVTASAGILAGGLALGPALANGDAVKLGPFSIVTCTSMSPCQQYNNNGAGPGLEGKTGKGFGLEGVANKGFGVYGQSTSGPGVDGNSQSGNGGQFGSDAGGYGVYAISFGSDAIYADADGGSAFDGVVGTSSGQGYGVLGISYTGNTAMYALAGTGDALDAAADAAGLQAIQGRNPASGGRGSDIEGQYIGMIGRSDASSCSTSKTYPLVLTDQNANDVFFVDCAGNVFYHGSLNTFTPTRGGQTVNAYGSKTTSPTIEDNGTGQLVNGQAIVRLDSTFAQTIDLRSAYHVMLTPDGDTRGLYVASKAPGYFVVREVQGGRNSLSFDYHIYAPALGTAGARMALASGRTGPDAHLVHMKIPVRKRVPPQLPRL
ncbi:MAG TPA: hypothetical protein VKT51_11730 [Candidatus Eremiobacteraceae bacterium]|nr:hypothetical protein [Candidatus Eremiobacteraceae bacterium]